MNRRNFFGNLGAIIAIAAAPTIFIPNIEPVIWKRPLIHRPRKVKLSTSWSSELDQDLKAYYNIDVEKEMTLLLNSTIDQEVAQKFPGAKVISVEKGPPIFCPIKSFYIYSATATII